MIEFRDVHKSFGDLEVLKGINLKIEKGQVVTLIGRPALVNPPFSDV